MAFVDPLVMPQREEAPPQDGGSGFVDPISQMAQPSQDKIIQEPTNPYARQQQDTSQYIRPGSTADKFLSEAKKLVATESGLSEFSIERATSWENSKPALIAAGALTGAAAGAPAGPLGILGGGVLGAGIATAGIGAVERTPLEENVSNIAKEMREEALFNGGAMAIGPAFKILGPWAGKMFGLDDAGIQQLVRDAERNKVPLALQDVVAEASRKSGKLAPSIAAGFPKVVGVFPFVSTPQRKAAQRVGAALERSVDDTLNTIAPNVTLSKLGIDVHEAAKNMSKEVKSIGSGLYDNFYSMADELGQPAIIPTTSVKKAVAELAAGRARPSVFIKGKEIPLPQPKIAKDLDNYIENLAGMKEYISPAELRSVEEDLGKFFSAANVKGYDVKQISTLKQALELAKQNIDVAKAADPEKAAQLKGALETANKWHAASMTLFGSPMGKKFEKVDKNIFNSKPFKQGEITADSLGPVIIKSANSPQMIKDLRNIIGFTQTGEVARSVIKKAKLDSVTDNILDFNKLEKNLKLDTQEGVEVMDELLKGTGINREKIQSLINVGKVHGSVELSEASTFLKRRLLLGGIGTAGLLTQPKKLLTVAVPATIFLRGGSKFLAEPKVLKWMTTAMDDTVNDKIRRVAVSNLIEQYAQFEATNGD